MFTALFLWGTTISMENEDGRTLYLGHVVQWGKTNFILGITIVLVIFSLCGIPPLGGFFAKFGIFLSCLEYNLYFGAIVGLLISGISVLYYLRIIKIVKFEISGWYRPRPISKVHALSLGLSAFFLIFFVFFCDLVMVFLQQNFQI
jgi:NADH-quinone oxidoreductase subunit N